MDSFKDSIVEYLNAHEVVPNELSTWENWTAGFVYKELIKFLKDAPRQDGGMFEMPSSRKMSKIIGLNYHTYLDNLKRLNELGYIRIINEGKAGNIRIQMKHTIAVEKYTELAETQKQLYIINKDGQKQTLHSATLKKVIRMGATDSDIKEAISACETYPQKINNLHNFFPKLFNPENGRCIAFDEKKGSNKKSKSQLFHADNPKEVPAFVKVSHEHSFDELSDLMQTLANGDSVDLACIPIYTLTNFRSCFEIEDDTARLHAHRVIVHLGDIVPERKGQWILPYDTAHDQIDFWGKFILPGECERKTAQSYVIGYKNGHEVKNNPGTRTIADFAKQFIREEVEA